MGNLNFQVIGEVDEFHQQGSTDEFLKNFKEGEMRFTPTFNYKMGTDEYLEEAGWPDRILFSEKVPQQMTPLLYGRAEINLSSHKPIFALFDAKVHTVKVEEKARCEQ